MPRIALIIGSTRPNRFADVPAAWVQAGAQARGLKLDTLDLRDHPLPLFEEPVPPSFTGGVYQNPAADAWRRRIGEYDGYILTAAEYNHGPTAVLKNALDSAFVEWADKPVTFVGYGGVGGSRAIEQLRQHAIELKMAPIRNAVHIGLEPFLGILQQGRAPDDYAYLTQAREAMFDQLLWWAEALKAARERKVA
ncbi:NADPH-dependent FMN reductase [Lysobacter sp. TAB13]|uniref:NADPH-dependent FMN reductase n=1 Tax=Lysobacter sp. TAB13 TaxID=3233065 RepID=UPI003F94F278